MNKCFSTLKPRFVDRLPEDLEEGLLYFFYEVSDRRTQVPV